MRLDDYSTLQAHVRECCRHRPIISHAIFMTVQRDTLYQIRDLCLFRSPNENSILRQIENEYYSRPGSIVILYLTHELFFFYNDLSEQMYYTTFYSVRTT